MSALPPIRDVGRRIQFSIWLSDKLRHDAASDGADAFRYLCTRFKHMDPVVVAKPPSDHVVLMGDKFGRVRYVRDDGAGGEEGVALQDVIWAHVRRKTRERED